MSYAHTPGQRFGYDIDGSIVLVQDSLGVLRYAQPTGVKYLSSDDPTMGYYNWIDTGGGSASQQNIGDHMQQIVVVFPELRDLSGIFYCSGTANSASYPYTYPTWQPAGPALVETSPDTGSGQDGTWNTLLSSMAQSINSTDGPGTNGAPFPPTYWSPGLFNNQSVGPAYQLGVAEQSRHIYDSDGYGTKLVSGTYATGVKGVRLTTITGAQPNQKLMLFGSFLSGVADRLAFWDHSTDTEIDPSTYFDYGNIAQGSSANKSFRIKNMSDTLTSTNISVGMDAFYDTTPAAASAFTFSLDGSTYFNSLTLADPLAPGDISDVITFRRQTPANAVLSIWAPRILAQGVWS